MTGKEKILNIIEEIQSSRETAHIVPPHVLTSEIINRGCSNPYKDLNELYREGKIIFCRTINETAFTIK